MTELATASVSLGTTQDGRALSDDALTATSICD
jgi:hypothetical protein